MSDSQHWITSVLLKCFIISGVFTDYLYCYYTNIMKRRKELWNYADTSHRAKRIVSMCLNKDNNGINLFEPDENLIQPEDILEQNTSIIDITDNLWHLEELCNDIPNSLTKVSNTSYIESSSIENTDHSLTELLPMVPENDYFGLLDRSQVHIGSEIYCEDSNSLSSNPPTIVNNNQPHLPVTIPETPNNSASDTSCATVDSHVSVKRSGKNSVKYPKLTNNAKILNNKKKYPIKLNKCKSSCRRSCSQFSDLERIEIWESYWHSSKDARLQWLARNIHLQPVSQRTTDGQSQKNTTRLLFLENKRGHSLRVCKSFFLNTLGMKNDSIITTVSKKIVKCPLDISDKRGRNQKQKIDTTLIKEHIMLYKPCIAHYRRHNSPMRQYLNQDINLVQLHSDYTEKYPSSKCCLEIYRRTLKEMNISLHRPQSDKCFDCEMFQNETNEAKEAKTVLSLRKMCRIIVHKNKAKQANLNYKDDADRESHLNTKIYSMDLEKSLLIPIIPDVKDCFFTSRLVVFNLTFASLKKKDSKTPAKCIVWHEATSGRDAKNIVDAIYKLLLSERDIKHFIFWADNCSSQNKNWYLFTALVTIVNSFEINSIIIKYLTKGHTHMTADGVHGNIENNIKKQKYIYDFEDFKTCVSTSRKDTVVIEVTTEDAYDWNKKKRNIRQKDKNDSLRSFLLKDVVEVKFVNGERTLLYKNKFQEEYKILDFLQKKYSVHELPKKNNLSAGRGIKTGKKKEIMDKLVPLMPKNRQQFWVKLPENLNSLDLIDQGEVVNSDA